MLNDILMSFFFGMPAVVALAHSRHMRTPAARAILFWGGCAAVLCAVMTILPMLACDGTIYDSYANCTGGAGVTSLANALLPISLLGAKVYILAGLPLAALAFVIDWVGTWRPRAG